MPRNNRISRCSLAFFLLLVAAPALAQSAKARPTDKLAWLTGCWEWRSPRGVVDEHWSSTSGGMLLGFSRTMRGDSITEYEFVRIYNAGDTLVYDAHPSRQERAEFRAVGPFESSVVFENPTHDFPQRVIYRRAGADTLMARVEGTRNGQTRGFDFPYVRTRCT